MRLYQWEIENSFDRKTGAPIDKAALKHLRQEEKDHDAQLRAILPPHIYALQSARVDDAAIRRIVWNRGTRELRLLLYVNDNRGQFDVTLHYSGCALGRETLRNFKTAARKRSAEFLYSEIDWANDEQSKLYVHQLVFVQESRSKPMSPSRRHNRKHQWYGTFDRRVVRVVFKDAEMTMIPRPIRPFNHRRPRLLEAARARHRGFWIVSRFHSPAARAMSLSR